jgi:hypothetical protein
VNISGGIVGHYLEARSGSAINITGGEVGANFDAKAGSVVSLSGGSIGTLPVVPISAYAHPSYIGGLLNMSDGTIGNRLFALDGSVVSIAGGEVERGISASVGSTVNVSGGKFTGGFWANANSTVNLFGSEFLINGEPILGLTSWESSTIQQRDVILSGALSDGSPFSFDLNSARKDANDYFDPAATLTVNLVASTMPGDFNGDGIVSAADYITWRNHQGTAFPLANRDPQATGNIGPADFDFWRANFGRTVASTAELAGGQVPEPAGIALAIGVLAGLVWRRRDRRDARDQRD